MFIYLKTEVKRLTNSTGEFSSPKYPNTDSSNVTWIIEANEQHRIFLQFLDFELFESDECQVDVVEVSHELVQ